MTRLVSLTFAGLLALGNAQAAAPSLDELLTRQDYRAAAPLLKPLLAKPRPTPDERTLIYRWLVASSDLAELDRRTARALEARPASPADLLAAGRLALELRNFERARACFERALASARLPRNKAEALRGLGQIAFQLRDFDASHARLRESLALHETADGLMALTDTLIRLGRTDEAVSSAQAAVRLNPFHEHAHYQLGNGYTRRNYTQLAADCGARFEPAMALVRRASDAFSAGRFDEARDLGFDALKQCPDLGRAHAILAKALESQRFAVDVHRADYERRFAALPMPVVPGIEAYVSNWADLSPRHRKRVALSVAPWQAFIPLLVESGARHFIKPMGMKLSETPGGAALKDARIEYDSRLWDDVRGAGGYSTVTGIEDVERSIFDRYNTVLHELSHQVHGVLTADQWREINELYRRAKTRDAQTKQGFLSRYAGGSVWEYFAEGANGLDSPRRDAYDGREIVRERLAEIDPALMDLVKRYFAQTDVSASRPVAFVNAGNDELSRGLLEPALLHFRKAQAAAPHNELVQAGLLGALALAGEREAVRALAAEALREHPASGSVRVAAADALWHAGRPLPEVLNQLATGADKLAPDDAFRVNLAAADYQRKLGNTAAALTSYERVLATQADSPEALWGKAATLALAQRWDEAFALYDKVLRLRTGLVPLRADHVRDLLRAGRTEPARTGLKEALLLDPQDPTLLALQAWLALIDQDAAAALRLAETALEKGPWCDLALILKAAALNAQGRDPQARITLAPLRKRLAEGAAPRYVFRADQSSWISVGELPAVEQALLKTLVDKE